jgi:hypothetical protein
VQVGGSMPPPGPGVFFSVSTGKEYMDTELGRMQHRDDLERLYGPA